MAPPRLSDQQKELSRERKRNRRKELQRLRRADPEYRLAERVRNTQARREQRTNPVYRKKERERDTRAHRDRRNRANNHIAVMRNIIVRGLPAAILWTGSVENMAPDQVGPDEDTGVTALNCGAATVNTTIFVTVPASTFPVSEELLSSENVSVGGGGTDCSKDKGNSTDDNEDDDLTSLSWLQNKNLLKGVHELPKTDYADDASSDSRSSSGQSISPVRCWPAGLPINNNNNKTSSLRSSNYDPKVHTESKPPYSFSCLIFMAIEDSAIKALPVKDIYGWIVDHFPYYKNAPTGWKNSVRHNLSLNKCFRKVEKAPNLGKGSLWMVEPSYRPCLIQALQKTPYTKGYSKKSTVNTSPTSRTETMMMETTSCKDERSEDEMSTVSDVDAATAMLVLKHGPHVRIVHDRGGDWQLTQTKPETDPELAELYPIVTICPSEDHTYDNCFKMDSLCKEDAEERRRIVEGADALLNLAGITTRRLRKRSSSVECIDVKRECTETLMQMYLKRQTDNNNEPSTVIIEHHKDKFR